MVDTLLDALPGDSNILIAINNFLLRLSFYAIFKGLFFMRGIFMGVYEKTLLSNWMVDGILLMN